MTIPESLKHILDEANPAAFSQVATVAPGFSQEELSFALVYAMENSTPEMVGLLLEKGATIGKFALEASLQRNTPAFFEQLLRHGWDIDSTKYGRPAVLMAIRNPTMLRWLLENGANPNTRNRRLPGSAAPKLTPLAHAVNQPDTSGLELLLEYGAEVDAEALFECIGRPRRSEKDRTHQIDILLDHQLDINCSIDRYGTPLHLAVTNKNPDMVRFLLSRGADHTIRDILGRTPLQQAVLEGATDIVQILEQWKKPN